MDAVTAVISRLQDGQTPWVSVKGLLALSDLGNQPLNRTPALFVFNVDERAAPDVRGSGPALQTVTVTLGVISVERLGNRESTDLMPLRRAIRQRLFGWAPTGFEALTLGGGRLLNISAGQVAWIDHFITDYTEDANHGA